MTQSEELQIIERVRGGEREAFELLVLENQNKIYSLALKTLKNPDDALDVSQEAFIKAYTSLETFRGESRFSVWLYRLTYNLCIDLIRKRGRQKEISLTYHEDDSEAEELEIPDTRALPEDDVMRAETRRAIAKSIDELGGDHREILLLRETAGMSYTDISKTLGISEGTVKSRIARARKRLASILVRNGTFPEFIRLKDGKEAREHE